MKLYNTATKKIEALKPIKKGKINFFVCGPTVYDYSHIGHAKTYIQMDLLARVLKANKFKVFYLQNITDIDDKIILRAQQQGIDWQQVGAKYEKAYYRDMESLNNAFVSQYVKATDYIDKIIRQVQKLIDKGFAYQTGDGIYFEIAKFKNYGKLSGRIEVKEDDAQSRIDASEQKRGWNDFCLWKFSKPSEPVWESPFGKGRPGWHVEDTAITESFFGGQYDIHGGAIDLIFPHHEAEIAQMESISGISPCVHIWTHAGFLTIKGSRMGKSKENFVTIQDVLKKGYNPMSLRLLMLQSHYRSQIDFSWDLLDAAQNRLRDLQAFADLRWQARKKTDKSLIPTLGTLKERFIAELSDDLNTPVAMSSLSDFIKAAMRTTISQADAGKFSDFIEFLDDVLGLKLGESQDISADFYDLIEKREKARKNKDWSESDKIRDILKGKGIEINDTDYGPIWSRT